jgi:hypothetical protein
LTVSPFAQAWGRSSVIGADPTCPISRCLCFWRGSWLSAVLSSARPVQRLWQKKQQRRALEVSSPAARLIEQVERSKTFTATIVGGKIEASSTRVVVKLKTRPSERKPDGIEEAHTERTDTPAGRAMSQRLQALKGHRVAIWVEVEQIPGSHRKVRVVGHAEDLGLEREFAPAQAAAMLRL